MLSQTFVYAIVWWMWNESGFISSCSGLQTDSIQVSRVHSLCQTMDFLFDGETQDASSNRLLVRVYESHQQFVELEKAETTQNTCKYRLPGCSARADMCRREQHGTIGNRLSA